MIQTKHTCQICARVIKATTGVIAHHGYTRPGYGWQTSSCMGARHLPYEISCDQLPIAIKAINNFIASQNVYLVEFVKNPPATLTRAAMSSYDEAETYPRPEGFDPNNLPRSYGYKQYYELEFSNRKHGIEMSIRSAERDLKFMEKRLADWKAPSDK